MNILALDTSGATASAAVICDGYLTGEISLRHGKTHSQKVIPMMESLLDLLDIKMKDIHLLAVANGPGSFTGLRIGVVTMKAMAYALDIPIAEVSSLMSLAYTLSEQEGVICPIMDARNRQVYTGIYRVRGNAIDTLRKDEGISVDDLALNLKELNTVIHFVGDAVPKYKDFFKEQGIRCLFAQDELYTHRAAATGRLAWFMRENGLTDAFGATPRYLRKSQAERMKEKNASRQGDKGNQA